MAGKAATWWPHQGRTASAAAAIYSAKSRQEVDLRGLTSCGGPGCNGVSFFIKKANFLTFVIKKSEAVSRHSKGTGLVIYLAFLAKVANLYNIILTAFKKYWPDIVSKSKSGTNDTFI